MKTRTHALLPLGMVAALGLGTPQAQAEALLKPYVLASANKAETVRQALTNNGFTIAGSYAPYDGTQIIIATHDTLKKAAAASKFGGYGAAVRVAVTEVAGQPQTSYTNPEYMKNAYRMKGDVSAIASTLEKALGKQKTFGSADGISAADLREYHYMMAMPYFDDQIELASYDSHASAIKKVEAGLDSGKGVKKVYRIDIPGKEEVVFGVGINEGEGADKTIMGAIDKGELRQSAHLPYEVLVSGNKAYILHGKFRIAQSFPDLGMGSFMTISAAPDAIENSLKAVIQ